ncbi:MAG: hypothetical protein ACJA1L_001684 [Paracoccaceae bacterium]|jgi:hypothetical protein
MHFAHIPMQWLSFFLWRHVRHRDREIDGKVAPMQSFSRFGSAVILVDHQVGANAWAARTPLGLLRRTVLILARFAVGTGMPPVLTPSQETDVDVQGPLMPELPEIAPDAFAALVKRTGVVNASDNEAFAAACRDTGERTFIMAVSPRMTAWSPRHRRADRRLQRESRLR